MVDKQELNYFDKVKALHKGAAAIGTVNTRKELYNQVNDIIQNLLGYPYSTIAVPEENHFNLISIAYNKEEKARTIPFNASSLPKRAYTTGKTQIINDTTKDAEYLREKNWGYTEIMSVLLVPVIVETQVKAVIIIDSKKKNGFTELDIDVFEMLSMHISGAFSRIFNMEDLIESENQIKAIMEQAEDAIVLMNYEDRIEFWNPAAQKMFGYEKDEALGKMFFDLLVPYSQKRKYVKNRMNMMRRDTSIELPSMECICIDKSGEELGVDVSHSFVTIQRNSYILRMMRDNTRRKKEEERLHALYTHISKLSNAKSEENIAQITREAASSVFGANHGSLALRKGDVLESLHHPDPEMRLRLPLSGKGITVRAFNSGEIQLVQDLTLDPDFVENYNDENLPSLSELDVPIKMDNQVVGVLNVESHQKDRFSEGDVRLMTIFAENIASTLKRIGIDKEKKHYELQLEALHRSATELGKARNKEELYDSSLKIVEEVLGFHWIGIAEPQEKGLKYIIIATGDIPNITIPYDARSITLRAFNNKASVLVEDVTLDPDYILVSDTAVNYKSELVVPVIVDNEVVVLVNIEASEAINETDRALMEIVAMHMASEIERIRYEEQIKEDEIRLRTIKEHAVDAILIANAERIVTLWNKSADRIFGYSADYAVGRKLEELIVSEEGRDSFREEFQLILEGKMDFGKKALESTVRRSNGEVFTIGFTAAPVTMKGEPHNLFIARDITIEKKVEEQLKQLNMELGRSNQDLENYTYVVSHDLKAPLRSIRSFSSFLLEDYGEKMEGDGKEYLDRIIAAVTRMDDLISDLLTISRIGRKFTDVAEIDLNKLLENIQLDLSATIEAKKAEIIVEKLPAIEGQQIWVSQLFTNLISNGLKFNKSERPTIKIICEHRNEELLFSVSDNGIGISKQYYESIFKLFERLHTTEEYEGTGAGLTICKKIVENFGGKMWVVSEEGKGSTFYFTYPIKK